MCNPRVSATTLMYSIYGYRLQRTDDPLLLRMEESFDNMAKAALPSSKYSTLTHSHGFRVSISAYRFFGERVSSPSIRSGMVSWR